MKCGSLMPGFISAKYFSTVVIDHGKREQATNV
jgi:hypothetical protein